MRKNNYPFYIESAMPCGAIIIRKSYKWNLWTYKWNNGYKNYL